MKILTLIMLILTSTLNINAQMEKSERYLRGWDKLLEIDGEAGENVVNSLEDISPDLGRLIIEYPFGEIYYLDKMNNKLQEIAAVASLVAQGSIPQLKVHLGGALHVGNTINEVKEVIIQMAVYAGYPKVINAMNAFREVLAERKEKGIIDIEGPLSSLNNNNRGQRGSEALAGLDPLQEQRFRENNQNLYPEITKFVIEHAFGDIYYRDNLDPKSRQVATIAALATLGNAQSQLKFHINAGMNVGLTIEELNGIMLLMSVYAGFPATINGANILNEVLEERERKL